MNESRILRFEPNVPQQTALKFADGLNVESRYGKPQVRYTLEDGRCMYLNADIAARLTILDLCPGEKFSICKRQNGSRIVWDIWLSPQTEQARATTEAQAGDLTPLLKRSIENVRQMKTPAMLAPTGTYGPAPRPAPAQARPQRIPFDIALREVIGFTTRALGDAGEQWADGAKQDLVSTVIIAACREGLIGCWQREAA